MTGFGKKNGSSQFVKTRPKLKTQFLNLMTTQKVRGHISFHCYRQCSDKSEGLKTLENGWCDIFERTHAPRETARVSGANICGTDCRHLHLANIAPILSQHPCLSNAVVKYLCQGGKIFSLQKGREEILTLMKIYPVADSAIDSAGAVRNSKRNPIV